MIHSLVLLFSNWLPVWAERQNTNTTHWCWWYIGLSGVPNGRVKLYRFISQYCMQHQHQHQQPSISGSRDPKKDAAASIYVKGETDTYYNSLPHFTRRTRHGALIAHLISRRTSMFSSQSIWQVPAPPLPSKYMCVVCIKPCR